jgi:hypothetical protein
LAVPEGGGAFHVGSPETGMGRRAQGKFTAGSVGGNMKGFYEYIELILNDGTVERWKADKRMKAQERKLNRLDREAAAIKKTLKELREKKPT